MPIQNSSPNDFSRRFSRRLISACGSIRKTGRAFHSGSHCPADSQGQRMGPPQESLCARHPPSAFSKLGGLWLIWSSRPNQRGFCRAICRRDEKVTDILLGHRLSCMELDGTRPVAVTATGEVNVPSETHMNPHQVYTAKQRQLVWGHPL